MFDPQSEYDVISRDIRIREFVDYWEAFVLRPPYQRKNVWNRKRQQELLDSLFRRFYIPRVVIREVRLDEGFPIIDKLTDAYVPGDHIVFTLRIEHLLPLLHDALAF